MPSFRASREKHPYTKLAGSEPIPGYVLIEPLGRGGFGEVWMCEGPGGLHKAIKFVPGNSESEDSPNSEVRNEYQGFQLVKAIRHPLLLSIERLDLLGTELVIVMELADQHIGDRFQRCIADGKAGVPREELLGYVLEAAEALDLFGLKHGLQHLDVKPGNLFLTGGHLQLGDFGLVGKIEGGKYSRGSRGFTPEYAAPEVIQGRIHVRSDQFSLALVYYEMLTGSFPFPGNSPRQIAEQIVSVAPDLSRLPERDRAAVGRALSRNPEERFPSCIAFARALVAPPVGISGGSQRLALITPTTKKLTLPEQKSDETPDVQASTPAVQQVNDRAEADRRTSPQLSRYGRLQQAPAEPAKVAAEALSTAETKFIERTPPPTVPAGEHRHDPFPFRLELVRSIFPVAYLLGRPSGDPPCGAEELVRAVVLAAQGEETPTFKLGRVLTQADGSSTCKFLTNIDPRVAQVKLNLLRDEGQVSFEVPSAGRIVIRQPCMAVVKSGLFGGSTMQETGAGLEVEVLLPEPGRGVAEVHVTGKLYGNPPADFSTAARPTITKLMQEVRKQINTVEERRKDPRFPAKFPITVFPIRQDGTIDPAIRGHCQDVSEGGLAFFLPCKPTARHVYLAFDEVPRIEGLAVLVQIVRSDERGGEFLLGGRYRLDFGTETPEK